MGQTILPGKPPIEITLRQSSRARRIALRVSGIDGRVTLSLPRGVREAEGLRFARDREAWLRRALAEVPPIRQVVLGGVVPVAGRLCRIEPGSLALEPDRVTIPGRPAESGRRVAALLRTLAREWLAEAVARHAAAADVAPGSLVLRDPQARWGSCSSDGRLMFSWRLAMAPPEVLDYVAAHEVAHLREMNHGPAFWALVRRLLPDHERQRDWLRKSGADLHRWRF